MRCERLDDRLGDRAGGLKVDVVETLSGKKHSFRAGDVIGLSSGMHITWTSKGPFTKKFCVITRDQLPE